VRKAALFFPLALASGLACGPGAPPEFSGSKAYETLKEFCALGPRVPNSEAHRRASEFIASRLNKKPFRLTRQEFSHYDSSKSAALALVNFIAAFHPERTQRVLFCTHWDSRPQADEEPDSALHSQPILGANDGGSGVAVLLALAGLLAAQDPKIGVDLVFFDGEDYGPEGRLEQYLLGSRHFAKNMGDYHCEYGILLDMVGDSDLTIFQEQYSATYAAEVNRRVFARAQKLGLSAFVPEVKHAVIDDHIPLLEKGLPVIDLIDFDYPFWHTLKDTPSACSPQSLEQVGRLLVSLIYQPMENGR
jgi:hypothetical protein